jgi:hypothetical protein
LPLGDVNGDGLDDKVASTPDSGKAYFHGSVIGTATPGIDDVAFASPIWTFATGFGSGFAPLFGSVRPLFRASGPRPACPRHAGLLTANHTKRKTRRDTEICRAGTGNIPAPTPRAQKGIPPDELSS